MARQFVKLSGSQANSGQAAPQFRSWNVDEVGQPLDNVNASAFWPRMGTVTGWEYKADGTKVPDIRAIALAPQTDVDGVMIQFKGDVWRFLGPGAVLFAPDGGVDTFKAQPAFPAPKSTNLFGVITGPVSIPFMGDCVLEVFTGACPPAGFAPRLMPQRFYPFNYASSISLPAATLDAAGQPFQPIAFVSGYNVERAQFSFISDAGIARAALAHARDPSTDEPAPTLEDYAESNAATDTREVTAALFNCAAPWLALYCGSAAGADIRGGAFLCVTRRFIG